MFNEPVAWVICVALICGTVIYIFRTFMKRLDAL
jgi:hypothetical protein